MARALPVVLLALVVLAGCGAPFGADGTAGTPTATNDTVGDAPSTTATGTTAAPDRAVAVRNGTLPVNATLVYDRLRTLLGTDVAPPERVVVDGSNASGATPVRPFWSAVGVERSDPSGGPPVGDSGYTTALGNVVIDPGEDSNASSVRTVLVHELVHYVQFAEGRGERLRAALPGTTDGEFVSRALLEGVAVHATDAYLDRHHPGARPNAALYERVAAAYPPGSLQRYANAQYREGTEYVAARLDDPDEAVSIYERPPRTGEQVVHGLAPGEEPARSLTVRASAETFTEVGRDTLGEPFVRTALAGAVDRETATRAATGWGNDSLVTVRQGDAVGYAWTLRWDDAANATEARDAFAVLLSSLPGDSRLVSVDDETVVVLLGAERFVDGTTVSGEGEAIRLRMP